jgi:hypothetical protein
VGEELFSTLQGHKQMHFLVDAIDRSLQPIDERKNSD